MSTTTAAEIAPPPVNRGMKVLDRSFFKRTVETSAITVFNPRDIQKLRAKLMSSRDILSATTIKPIVDDDSVPGAKCILVKPHVKASDPSTWSEKWSQDVKDGTAKVRPYTLTLTYDDWKMSDILDAVLPPLAEDDEQNPNGFAQVGHVAHVNLREQFLPYKNLIGEVLLDKNPSLRTVINKLHDVGTESVFRTFPYEVLAGPDDLNVIVHHSDCVFYFNFSEVYWNTRNGHEHERLTSSFKEGEAVCDVTAGVGPFAIPAGKKRVWVRANDLNPACYEALCTAIEKNKVSEFVCASQLDGAEFIKSATKQLLQDQRTAIRLPKPNKADKVDQAKKNQDPSRLEEYSPFVAKTELDGSTSRSVMLKASLSKEPATFDHYVINLPATGIEFLQAFKGIYHGQEDLFAPTHGRKLPMIHVYTFQARKDIEDEEKEELQSRLSDHLGFRLSNVDELELHRARLVSPGKLYYCASFRLPAEVAFSKPAPAID